MRIIGPEKLSRLLIKLLSWWIVEEHGKTLQDSLIWLALKGLMRLERWEDSIELIFGLYRNGA